MAGTSLVFDILAKDRASGTFRAFGKEIDNLDKKARGLSHFGDIGGKVALGATAGIAAIVGVTANFEKAMSSVKAATGEGESGMNALRDAAIQAGADTAFSASEAAAGIENLAKAGVSTQDILGGGLAGALDLAAAGEMEVADAAEAAAGALAQFKLEGDQASHVADLLAAGAGKAQGDVSDMVMALKQAGTVSAQTGLSIEETTGALAAMAEQSLLGSDAGTSFKTMLAALTPNSAKAAAAMEQYNIHAFDAQGNFVGMTALAGQLRDGLGDLTDEQRAMTLETIFGSDAVRAASIIYDNGAEGIQSWTDKVNDSGFAAEQAATKLDNLAGDFEALKGSLETALIGAGSGSQAPLRSLVQSVTDGINAFNDLPPAAQGATTKLLGITAVLGGGLWFTSKVVTGIANTSEALKDLGVQANATKGALASMGKVGTLLALAAVLPQIQKGVEGVAGAYRLVNDNALGRDLETLLKTGDAVGEIENLNSWLSVLDDNLAQVTASGFGWVPFDTPTLTQAEESLAKIDAQLAQMVESGNAEQAAAAMAELEARAADLGTSTDQLPQIFTEYRQALINAGEAVPGAFLSDLIADAIGAVGPTKDLAGATDDLGDSARTSAKDIRGLVDAMHAQRDAAISAFDAETQYREALKAATKAAKDNSAGIKGNSKAALENRGHLSDLAQAWNNQSEATRNNTAKFREARDAFVKTAVAMGVPIAKAKELARELLAIPKQRVIDIHADGDAALTKIRTVKTELNGIDRPIHIPITLHVQRTGDGGTGLEFGSGGNRGRVTVPRLAPSLERTTTDLIDTLRSTAVKAQGNQFKGIGANIVQALVRGVNGTAGQAEKAIDRMMKAIKKAVDDKKITEAAAKRMRETVQAMAREGDKLRSLLGQRMDFARELKSSFAGEMDLGALVTAEGGFGGIGALTGGYSNLAARLRAFAGQLKELRKAGIPRGLISEIASLGSDQGAQVAASILAADRGSQSALSQAFNAFQSASGFAGNAGADAVHGTVRQIKQENHVTIHVKAGVGADGSKIGREVAREMHKELLRLKRELNVPLGLT